MVENLYICLKKIQENKIKLFWTYIKILEPSDPKVLGTSLNFSDPMNLGPSLCPILGSESGSSSLVLNLDS